jgi:hypothetical protein
MAETSSNANETKDQPATISAPPGPTITLDPQNPLPEASFLWRRLMTFFVAAVLLGLDWYVASKLHTLGKSDDLLTFAKWNIVLNGLILTYYFLAPSASELTNMIQTASIFKHSISAATLADKNVSDRAESYAGRRFEGDKAPDSQIPASTPGEAPTGLSGDVGDSADVDAAPTSQP